MAPPLVLHSASELDLLLTLGPLRRGGASDPTIRFGADGVWRATRTPEGPATTHLAEHADGIAVQVWGPGAGWALNQAARLVGLHDTGEGFAPRQPLLAELHRRYAGLRLPRTEAVFEALVPTILEQKVPGIQAQFAYASLVRSLGEPAPGPGGLRLPPSPVELARTPYWVFHRLGVERRRAEAIHVAALHARRLEETVWMSPLDARRRLAALPGIGSWSVEEVALRAFGDPDAVSVGDYHLPHMVTWALAGIPRGTDEQMLRLLEPYRGHRARVIRLLEVGGARAPRFGPRMPLRWITRE